MHLREVGVPRLGALANCRLGRLRRAGRSASITSALCAFRRLEEGRGPKRSPATTGTRRCGPTSSPVLHTYCAWRRRPMSTATPSGRRRVCGLRPPLATLVQSRSPGLGRRGAVGGRPTRSAPSERHELGRGLVVAHVPAPRRRPCVHTIACGMSQLRRCEVWMSGLTACRFDGLRGPHRLLATPWPHRLRRIHRLRRLSAEAIPCGGPMGCGDAKNGTIPCGVSRGCGDPMVVAIALTAEIPWTVSIP